MKQATDFNHPHKVYRAFTEKKFRHIGVMSLGYPLLASLAFYREPFATNTSEEDLLV